MEQKRVAPYAEAFRQQMVELIAAGRRPMELAREFGCSDGSIHAWVKKAGRIVDLPRGAHVLQAGIGGSRASTRCVNSGLPPKISMPLPIGLAVVASTRWRSNRPGSSGWPTG